MKSFLYFGLLLLLAGSTACEKESYDYTQPNLTPEERFDRAVKPQVLFQFAQRQLATGQETGWIVDHEGWVKTYARTFTPGTTPSSNNEIVAELEVHNLYSSTSEGLFQIEKAELANRFFQSVSLLQNQLSAITDQPEAEMTQAFFAYTQKTIHQVVNAPGGGNCNNGSSSEYVSITEINRSIVNLSGPQSRFTTADKGQELHQWLLTLDGELQGMVDQ